MNGAVLCENAVLECGAELFEDSVVGAGSVVGKHVSVGPHVKIWPKKRIEDGMRVWGNIKYGSPQAELFRKAGFAAHKGCLWTQFLAQNSGWRLRKAASAAVWGLPPTANPPAAPLIIFWRAL